MNLNCNSPSKMEDQYHQMVSTIILFNNKGANYLEVGEFDVGLECLSEAMHIAVGIIRHQAGQQQDGVSSSPNNYHEDIYQIDDWMESASIDDDNAFNNGPSFVYRRPIHIPGNNHQQHLMSSCTIVACTIMFNLALGFLLQGQSDSSSSCSGGASLEKALKLFRCAIQLKQSHEEDLTGETTVTLFSMAALNNARFLYERMGRIEDANTCSRGLSSALIVIMMSTENLEETSKYEAFFNLLIDPTTCSTCAGAA